METSSKHCARKHPLILLRRGHARVENEQGSSMLEYALALATLVLVILGAVVFLFGALRDRIEEGQDHFQDLETNDPGIAY